MRMRPGAVDWCDATSRASSYVDWRDAVVGSSSPRASSPAPCGCRGCGCGCDTGRPMSKPHTSGGNARRLPIGGDGSRPCPEGWSRAVVEWPTADEVARIQRAIDRTNRALIETRRTRFRSALERAEYFRYLHDLWVAVFERELSTPRPGDRVDCSSLLYNACLWSRMTETGGALPGASEVWFPILGRYELFEDEFLWGVRPFPTEQMRCVTCVRNPHLAIPPPPGFDELIESLIEPPFAPLPPGDPRLADDGRTCLDGRRERPILTNAVTSAERSCLLRAWDYANSVAGRALTYVRADSLEEAYRIVARHDTEWSTRFRQYFMLTPDCSLDAGGAVSRDLGESALEATRWTNDRFAPVSLRVVRADGTAVGRITVVQAGTFPPAFPERPDAVRIMGCP